MINWKSERWRVGNSYSGGDKLLGVLTISTDEGLQGHCFLGTSRQGADAHVVPLMEFIKPILVDANPLDIGAIWKKIWAQNRYVATFAGLAPAGNPRLAVVVVIDEPAGGDYYGGKVAAPVFANIVTGATRILAIPPDDLRGTQGNVTVAARE